MANKNLSQLPTNATPQETDWLLGASGVSPAVFQKIPVGAIQSGGSGGSIKFSLPVNQNTALTSSGYYFTDSIAANIGIDCSQLGIGDHISWVNLSTKAIIFYGLATVNGTTIPANKGVRIEANTSIEFFLKDANFNARVLIGSYIIGWIPGQEPSSVYLPYSSVTDLNGAVNYLGTDQGQTSYTNPYPSKILAKEIVYTGSYIGLSSGSWNNLFNKLYTVSSLSGELKLNTNPFSDVGVLIEFLEGKTITPSVIAIYANKSANPSFTGTLKGVKPDNSTVNLATNIIVSIYQQAWEIITVNTTEIYKGFIFHGVDMGTIFINEFECWGTLYL